MSNTTLRFMLLVALLSAIAFLACLGRARIVTSHEARIAVTAATMFHSGLPWAAAPVAVSLQSPHLQAAPPITVNPWVIPVYNGAPRLQKPPLPYWSTAGVYLALGASELTSRLIPALFGVVATLLVYDLARRLAGRSTARWAALVWVSTFFVIGEFRKVMADPYLAFFSLLAIWAWVWISRRPSPPPAGRRAAFALLLFYLAVALGLLSKGPVLFLHVLIPLRLYAMLYDRRPRLPWVYHAAGVLLVLLVTLPWPAYVALRVPGALELWRFESVGEFADNARNARPWYFYLPALLQLSLPWTPVWVAGLFIAARRPRRTLLFPVFWMAALVLVFSLAHMKKNAYLLPLMPAQTLIIAHVLTMAQAWARRQASAAWPKLLLDVQVTLGIVLGIGVSALVLIGPVDGEHALPLMEEARRFFEQALGRMATLNGAAAALALAVALVPLHRIACRTIARRSVVQACVYFVLIVLAVDIVDPADQNRRPPLIDFAAVSTSVPHPAAEPHQS